MSLFNERQDLIKLSFSLDYDSTEGRPSQNSPKYFAAIDILARGEDAKWLSEATKMIAKHWAAKNHRRVVTQEAL